MIGIILNDEELDKETKEEKFKLFFEKVVDISLRFSPSAQESTEIAVKGNDAASTLLRDSAIALGMSNIRVIKRVERAVKQVTPTSAGKAGPARTKASCANPDIAGVEHL